MVSGSKNNKALVFDWNGSFVSYNEGMLWKYVARGMIEDAYPNDETEREVRILEVDTRLESMSKQYNSGEIEYKDIFDYYNRKILRGKRIKRVHDLVDDFAKESETRGAVTQGFVEPLIKAWRNGIRLCILSTGYRRGIRSVVDHQNLFPIFIMANDMETEDGKSDFRDVYEISENDYSVRGVRLEIYWNKEEFLPQACGWGLGNEFDPENTVYVGDTREDEGCFDSVAHPVLSPHAKPEYRNRFRERFPHGLVLDDNEESFREFDGFLNETYGYT